MFPVQGVGNVSAFIQKQKAFLAVNLRFLVRSCPSGNDGLETGFYIWCHRNDPDAILCFRGINIIAGFSSLVYLVVDSYAVFLEVDIFECQSAKLRYS